MTPSTGPVPPFPPKTCANCSAGTKTTAPVPTLLPVGSTEVHRPDVRPRLQKTIETTPDVSTVTLLVLKARLPTEVGEVSVRDPTQ